ncbi:MAG: YbaB/EbfC family nucleoid-associated protein [Cyclobacteriaceae bacterium]|jgi:DNA-binding YbaB/EbfC family protein|nr:YbaB/EbfC family nucleoid-associated protein [Flammeovirgaceae bacterium]MCZ8020670.1 YbaB/EbfC family nucleoid-associated protein [Cytophagales bacterium]MCZ8326871.1 YbaB/EbfC family nucleoid-associated protein [Cyclobacteriaceae bacterium]
MFDMMNMLGKMKDIQARLKQAQDNLVHLKISAESGAGMVKATVNGKKHLVSIEIDPSLLKETDKQILQDLIVAAINKANEEAEVQAKEQLKKSTEGLLPNIPGMDLSNLFG